MCGKIMTVLLIFVVLNCSMARYNGRLHCIVGVLPTCYKRKAATYFYPPGGTGPIHGRRDKKLSFMKGCGEVTLARVHLPPLTCYLKVWLSFLKTFSTDVSVQEVNKSEDASNFTRA